MLIYGAGGHGKVVLSAAIANQILVSAFFDDYCTNLTISNIPIRKYDPSFRITDPMVLAIGCNRTREKLVHRVHHTFANLVHPTALVDDEVKIGKGNIILHRSIVQTHVIIGHHTIINTAAIVEHDCQIDDFVHIGPGATLCGGVHVGRGTLIGAGSTVVPGIKIGAHCLIGAGVVITRHVPDNAVVKGCPARIIRSNTVHY
jgi:sugar O-acyltransferase (sialic acid O-acetyltransferase NeuD family)